jgi:Grx4 family monothiol glutaredoxin
MSNNNNSLVQVTSAPLPLGDKRKAVLLFGASWHEECVPLEAILRVLATTAPDVLFGNIDAEEVAELTDTYEVTAVPTLILLNGDSVLERLEGGVDPSQVTVAVQRLLAAAEGSSSGGGAAPPTTTTTANPEQALTERLDRLIRRDAVMLFMKGVPSAPKCGFSRQVVEVLNAHQVPFGCFDILSDDAVRQGLKKHSNWPTYPQLYVNGELQGGLDILKELAEDGPLLEQWNLKAGTGSSSASAGGDPLNDRLAELVKRNDVMIFMKGLPSAPQCGFSRQIIHMLDETGVPYDAFDILQDDDVRQGLKSFSNWPTFPQLYVKGELVGGLDIVQELEESGELMDVLQQQ